MYGCGYVFNQRASSRFQAYYSSASDDEITIRENRLAFQRSGTLSSLIAICAQVLPEFGSVHAFCVMFLLSIGQLLFSVSNPVYRFIS